MPPDSKEALRNFHRSQSSRSMKSEEFQTQVSPWLAPRFSGFVPERMFPRNRQCMDEVASVKMDTESLSQGLIFL